MESDRRCLTPKEDGDVRAILGSGLARVSVLSVS
jgi:hypothetical protein